MKPICQRCYDIEDSLRIESEEFYHAISSTIGTERDVQNCISTSRDISRFHPHHALEPYMRSKIVFYEELCPCDMAKRTSQVPTLEVDTYVHTMYILSDLINFFATEKHT